MEYIISDREKKAQTNPLLQFWRFLCLSFRFMNLTCACCQVPPREASAADPPGSSGAPENQRAEAS
jgi:hypothetical protein